LQKENIKRKENSVSSGYFLSHLLGSGILWLLFLNDQKIWSEEIMPQEQVSETRIRYLTRLKQRLKK